jgi:hypothetical protein
MFRTTRIHIAQGIAVTVAAATLLVPSASATRLITDTLAPGGSMSPQHRWFLIEHSNQTAQPQGYHFITDTLAPGGSAVPPGYRFITDTLAPGGGASGVAFVSGTGFSWADAGIGAVVMSGLMLLALMGRQLAARRRGGQLAY